jgi:hypothetical protein
VDDLDHVRPADRAMTPRELAAIKDGLQLVRAHAADGYLEDHNFGAYKWLSVAEIDALIARLTQDHLIKLVTRVSALVEWNRDYNAALNVQEIPPNGDDFNELSSEIDHILAGGEPTKIDVTEEGR